MDAAHHNVVAECRECLGGDGDDRCDDNNLPFNNDFIEPFNELNTLGAITSWTNTEITLDLHRLHTLGYMLIFKCEKPIFITILDFSYLYNPTLYIDNVIPIESLESFKLMKIKNLWFSC